MLFSLFLGLIIGAGVMVFAFQNIFPVTVSFLGWELTSSLATLIILSMIVGALISALITIPKSIKNYLTIAKLQKENKKLAEEALAAQKAKEEVVINNIEKPKIQPTS